MNEVVLARLRAALGPFRVIRPLGGAVVEIEAGGRRLVVKPNPRKARREIEAYRRFAPALGDRAPRLVWAEEGVLVLSFVEGTPVEVGSAAIHADAGRLLAALHGLAIPDDDPLPLLEAHRRRAEALVREAKGTAFESRADGLLERVWALGAAERVPCHRDFEPRNWLEHEGRVAIVDLEHARLDDSIADLTRLFLRIWIASPELERAFRSGYGRAIDPVRLRTLAECDVLRTELWAAAHDDDAFRARAEAARSALERFDEERGGHE